MYWIERIEDGSFVAGAKTYEQAIIIQNNLFKEGKDTYIRKE